MGKNSMTSSERGAHTALYHASGLKVFKAPISTQLDGGGTVIQVGFPVCAASEYLDEDGAKTIAELLCRGEAMSALVDTIRATLADVEWALSSCMPIGSAAETMLDDVEIRLRAAVAAACGGRDT